MSLHPDAQIDKDGLLLTVGGEKLNEATDAPQNLESDIIIASKGIEISSSMFLSNVVNSVIKPKSLSILSGPCFSDEVAQDLPTAATFASSNSFILFQEC